MRCLWTLGWLFALACGKESDHGRKTGPKAEDVEDGLVLNEVSSSDFVEVLNRGDAPVELADFELRSTGELGPLLSQPLGEGSLAPGEMVLVTGLDLKLDLGSYEALLLVDLNERLVDEVAWEERGAVPSLGRLPDGTGPWKRLLAATPGTPNTDALPQDNPSPVQVVINEVAAGGNQNDPIELFSMEDAPISLQDWWYLDSSNNPQNERFVLGDITLEPGQFLVLSEHDFGLREEGDQVALFDADNRLVDVVVWDIGEANLSFCRVPDGTDDPGPCSQSTMGEPNVP